MVLPQIHEMSIGKIRGASPSEDRFYIAVLFDISDSKKYRHVIKILKGYGERIQYSIFEAYLKPEQIKKLLAELKDIMSTPVFYNPDDKLRVYRIAGNCELTVFGSYTENIFEQDVFI